MIFRDTRARAMIAILLSNGFVLLRAVAADAQFLAYVANSSSDSVSVIDTATATVISAVAGGNSPHGVAITPDGSRAYVTNRGSGTLSVINTATNAVVATCSAGGKPFGVAVTPDGARAYVANSLVSGTVTVIDTPCSPSAVTPVGRGANSVAITPDGTRAYVANSGADTVSVIDIDPSSPTFNTVIDDIAVGSGPSGTVASLDGRHVYVASDSAQSVSVIETTTNSLVDTIVVSDFLFGIAILPDGSRVYTTIHNFNGVAAINPATKAVTRISTDREPVQIAVTPDGNGVYVTNRLASNVAVIDVSANAVATTVAVGANPVGIAVTPFIDIKPGAFPNSVNPRSEGNIPVAILSNAAFDAVAEVLQPSLTFGRTGSEQSLSRCGRDGEDVNGDGLLDLVCHFFTQIAAFQQGDSQGFLRGETLDGTPIGGSDSVRTVGR